MDNYYDTIAKSYNELYWNEQLNKLKVINNYLVSKNVVIDSTTKILDVGCGTGIVQDFFERKYHADTFGIDPSESLIKQNQYQCMLSDAEDMPFSDGEFDIVISLTALQNFDDLDHGLMEIKRVGKDFFIITFLKRSNKAELMEKLIKKYYTVKEKIEEDKDLIFICGLV